MGKHWYDTPDGGWRIHRTLLYRAWLHSRALVRRMESRLERRKVDAHTTHLIHLRCSISSIEWVLSPMPFRSRPAEVDPRVTLSAALLQPRCTFRHIQSRGEVTPQNHIHVPPLSVTSTKDRRLLTRLAYVRSRNVQKLLIAVPEQ